MALTVAAVSDDGDVRAPGTEGTIVSVYRGGEAYLVEFPTPVSAPKTVRPEAICFGFGATNASEVMQVG